VLTNIVFGHIGYFGQHLVGEVAADALLDVIEHVDQSRIFEVSAVGGELFYKQPVFQNMTDNFNDKQLSMYLDHPFTAWHILFGLFYSVFNDRGNTVVEADDKGGKSQRVEKIHHIKHLCLESQNRNAVLFSIF